MTAMHTMEGEGMPMEDMLAFTTTINTLAVAVAAELEDEELVMLAASLVQLGDTLATIAARRELAKKCCGK